MNKLKLWYAGLQAREQRFVLIGAVGLGVLLLLGGILLPLHSAVSAANGRYAKKRDDLAWMQANAAEIQAGSSRVAADTGEAPVVLVDRIGRESGLGNSLRGTQPDANGVRVQLEAAPFDTMITWLGALDERYGLSIESISVDHGAKAGEVNANITFAPPRT